MIEAQKSFVVAEKSSKHVLAIVIVLGDPQLSQNALKCSEGPRRF